MPSWPPRLRSGGSPYSACPQATVGGVPWPAPAHHRSAHAIYWTRNDCLAPSHPDRISQRSGRETKMGNNLKHPTRRKVIGAMGVGAAGALAVPTLFGRPARAAGRTIKIGMVSPQTGPIAAFGEADQWVLGEVRKVLANGITVAGEQHPVEIVYRDSQSNPNRASEVAAQLINNDHIDIMVASSTSDTVLSLIHISE